MRKASTKKKKVASAADAAGEEDAGEEAAGEEAAAADDAAGGASIGGHKLRGTTIADRKATDADVAVSTGHGRHRTRAVSKADEDAEAEEVAAADDAADEEAAGADDAAVEEAVADDDPVVEGADAEAEAGAEESAPADDEEEAPKKKIKKKAPKAPPKPKPAPKPAPKPKPKHRGPGEAGAGEEAAKESFDIDAVAIAPHLRSDLKALYNSILRRQALQVYDPVVGDLQPSKFVPHLVTWLEREHQFKTGYFNNKKEIEETKEPREYDALFCTLKEGVKPAKAVKMSKEELHNDLVKKWRSRRLLELALQLKSSMQDLQDQRDKHVQEQWTPFTRKVMEKYKRNRAEMGPVEDRWDPNGKAAKTDAGEADDPIDLRSPSPPPDSTVKVITYQRDRELLKNHKERADMSTTAAERKEQRAHAEGRHGFQNYYYCSKPIRDEMDALAETQYRDASYKEWAISIAPFDEDEDDPEPGWQKKLALNELGRAKQRKALDHIVAVHNAEYDRDHDRKAVAFLLPGGKAPKPAKAAAAAAAAVKKADARLTDVPLSTLLIGTEKEFRALKDKGAWTTPKTHYKAARKAADKICKDRTEEARTPEAEAKAAELMFRLGLVQARGSTPYAQELLDRITKQPNKLNAAVAGYMKNIPEGACALTLPLPKIRDDTTRPKDADPSALSEGEELSDAEDESDAESWDADEKAQIAGADDVGSDSDDSARNDFVARRNDNNGACGYESDGGFVVKDRALVNVYNRKGQVAGYYRPEEGDEPLASGKIIKKKARRQKAEVAAAPAAPAAAAAAAAGADPQMYAEFAADPSYNALFDKLGHLEDEFDEEDHRAAGHRRGGEDSEDSDAKPDRRRDDSPAPKIVTKRKTRATRSGRMIRVEQEQDSGSYTPPFPLSHFTEEDREHFCCQQTGLTFRYPVDWMIQHVKDQWTDPVRVQDPLFRILCYWQRAGITPHSVLAEPVSPYSWAWRQALQQETRDADAFFAEQQRQAEQDQLAREFEQEHEDIVRQAEQDQPEQKERDEPAAGAERMQRDDPATADEFLERLAEAREEALEMQASGTRHPDTVYTFNAVGLGRAVFLTPPPLLDGLVEVQTRAGPIHMTAKRQISKRKIKHKPVEVRVRGVSAAVSTTRGSETRLALTAKNGRVEQPLLPWSPRDTQRTARQFVDQFVEWVQVNRMHPRTWATSFRLALEDDHVKAVVEGVVRRPNEKRRDHMHRVINTFMQSYGQSELDLRGLEQAFYARFKGPEEHPEAFLEDIFNCLSRIKRDRNGTDISITELNHILRAMGPGLAQHAAHWRYGPRITAAQGTRPENCIATRAELVSRIQDFFRNRSSRQRYEDFLYAMIDWERHRHGSSFDAGFSVDGHRDKKTGKVRHGGFGRANGDCFSTPEPGKETLAKWEDAKRTNKDLHLIYGYDNRAHLAAASRATPARQPSAPAKPASASNKNKAKPAPTKRSREMAQRAAAAQVKPEPDAQPNKKARTASGKKPPFKSTNANPKAEQAAQDPQARRGFGPCTDCGLRRHDWEHCARNPENPQHQPFALQYAGKGGHPKATVEDCELVGITPHVDAPTRAEAQALKVSAKKEDEMGDEDEAAEEERSGNRVKVEPTRTRTVSRLALAPNGGSEILVPGQFRALAVESCLLDTGAQISMINGKYYDKHAAALGPLQKSRYIIRVANGEKAATRGQIVVPFTAHDEFNGKKSTIDHLFLVVDGLDTVAILGMDINQKLFHGTTFEGGSVEFKKAGVETRVRVANGFAPCVPLLVRRSTCVLGRTMRAVHVTLAKGSTFPANSTVIVEPGTIRGRNGELMHLDFVPHLTLSVDPLAPISYRIVLRNHDARQLRLEQGCIIGHAHQTDERFALATDGGREWSYPAPQSASAAPSSNAPQPGSRIKIKARRVKKNAELDPEGDATMSEPSCLAPTRPASQA